MSIIYSICNQKGGVGKTTTAVNLAAFLAAAGNKVLLIDLDPQGNATSGVGLGRENFETSMYEVMIEGVNVQEAIKETKIVNLFITPSTTELAGADIELVGEMAREFKLKEVLRKIKGMYEYIIIDTPPSLSLLTINALSASDEVIIPIQCEYYALEGLSQLVKTVDLVKMNLNKKLKIGGILLTMYDSRLVLSNQVREEVADHFGDILFKTMIPRNVRLSEAPSHGMPILFYDPTSSGSISYEALAREIMESRAKKQDNEALQMKLDGSEADKISATEVDPICQSKNADLAGALEL